MAHEAGKGSKPRPLSVSQDEYDNRWDTIFGRDLEKNSEMDKITRYNLETQEVKNEDNRGIAKR